MKEMAKTAIQQIHPEKGAAIIGFSMGGMVAMEIARQAPGLIKKLALINSNAHADLPGTRLARSKQLEQAKTDGMGKVISQYYIERYLYQPDSKVSQTIVDMAEKLGPTCFAAQIEALATRPDSSKLLANIQCPTLILGSTHDVLCPVTEQTRMHQLLKQSTLEIVDNCGHFSTLERPDRVNEALKRWYLQDHS